jgi:hypothetical protein
MDRKTEVLSPGIFAPKNNWALRLLTIEEVLVAKDFSKVLADLLTSGPITNRFLRELIPGKSLIGLARRWGCNGGGRFSRNLEKPQDLTTLMMKGLERERK